MNGRTSPPLRNPITHLNQACLALPPPPKNDAAQLCFGFLTRACGIYLLAFRPAAAKKKPNGRVAGRGLGWAGLGRGPLMG